MRHEGVVPGVPGKTADPKKLPLRELTEQALLQQVAPAAALVNGQGDILYLHGRTGMYLEPAPGEAATQHPEDGPRRVAARPDHGPAQSRGDQRDRALPGPARQNQRRLHYGQPDRPAGGGRRRRRRSCTWSSWRTCRPRPRAGAACRGAAIAEAGAAETDADARVAALKQELRAKEEYLQTANEELETSNEELKSSNEEMQSVNEELQSTNEELETSKEELQSVNEELATVNAELQAKVADLSRVNNDMNNLLAGTGIGTVFVDHQLRIHALHPLRHPDHQPDPGRRGAARGPHRLQPGGLRHAWWRTCRRCWTA